MALKKYKPTTPGQRFKVISAFDEITTDKPEKSLLRPKKSTGGRNSSGEMTVRYRGGGHKRMYRVIDFKRDKDGIPGVVTPFFWSACWFTYTHTPTPLSAP